MFLRIWDGKRLQLSGENVPVRLGWQKTVFHPFKVRFRRIKK